MEGLWVQKVASSLQKGCFLMPGEAWGLTLATPQGSLSPQESTFEPQWSEKWVPPIGVRHLGIIFDFPEWIWGTILDSFSSIFGNFFRRFPGYFFVAILGAPCNALDAKLGKKELIFSRKSVRATKTPPLILSNHLSVFGCFSILRGSTSVNKTSRKAIENQRPDFMDFGGHLGVSGRAFWEHFGSPGKSFSRVFLAVFFWTSPGATSDRQRGVPGVLDTDRPSKGEDNFSGLGPRGGGQP